MEKNNFWSRSFFGIRFFEWAFLLFFYASFAFFYNFAIYFASGSTDSRVDYALLDYGLKALLTIPVWWLMFRKLSHWQIWKKVLLHILILPIFTLTWQQIYYFICEATGLFHLPWPGAWWDIYIPSLFYFVQFGLYHVYDFNIKLQKQQKLESDLRQIALQSELTALKSQLNPHFLYNVFNTISASLPPNQETTREMIAKLSDLFRYQLKSSKVDQVRLSEEIALVEKYLDLEKYRFGDRLRFQINLEKGLENFMVPPMLLQPIVENAIKHGIAPRIEGGSIEINIEQVNDSVKFEVIDDGPGINLEEVNKETGIGLTNTKKRLEKIYHTDLLLQNILQGGASVQFKLPIHSS